ncbi:MAG: cell division protein FtsW, partial [Clostridia bacterium]|nr:cell division protein FtsW [Clostridia bacterium]
MVLILVAAGLIMLFSASYAFAYYYEGSSYAFISKQLKFAIIGLVLMYGISFIDYRWLAKMHIPWILYGASIAMLGLVLALPVLDPNLPYKRWLPLGFTQFQPSEIAKFSIIVLFAYLISKYYKKMEKFSFSVLTLGALLGVICALVVVEPHLSATLLICGIGALMIIVGGIKLKYVLVGGIGGLSAVALVVFTGIVPYATKRLEFWFDPWKDPQGKGYQTIQSLLAIGSGGLFGRGLGQSRQKYLWVPEPHNDFIFSIICEELGFIGGACVILVFALLVWRGVTIAMNAPDRFGSMLTVGIVFQVGLQAMLNILVVTNMMPNTGISLPFFSYGGTSLIMLLAQ